MVKQILTLTLLAGCYSLPTFAANTPWVFTTLLPAKHEMIRIPKKEFCRPISTTLMSDKCMKYKQGYVCPQEDSGQFVISTYSNKKDCNKALNKAKRLLAKK